MPDETATLSAQVLTFAVSLGAFIFSAIAAHRAKRALDKLEELTVENAGRREPPRA